MNKPLNVMIFRSAAEAHQFSLRCILGNAPDNRSETDARRAAHASYRDAHSPANFFYELSGDLEKLRDIAHLSRTDAITVKSSDKWGAREQFYELMRHWAEACFDLHQSSPEDDSDPCQSARSRIIYELRAAGFEQNRVDTAEALFRSVVLERREKDTLLDVLEHFGDEASELSWSSRDNSEDNEETFWDVCVMLSDAIRAEITAAQVKKTVVPVVRSSEPENAGEMWEVCGDPHGALFRYEDDAARWAREQFPFESEARRSTRVRYRTILQFAK
jgi:hypothetical protein